jgi:hypothetical protein
MSYPQHDPGDEQPEPLFDSATTIPKRCRHCGVTRRNLCKYEADRAHQIGNPRAVRPRACLNTSQTRDFPEGY